MRETITILLLIITSSAFAFDYPQYVKHYLDSVNNIQVGDGVCKSLIHDMLDPIEDSMLIDHIHYGTPIKLQDARTGDIIKYHNHIVIVYSNVNGQVKIADQNRSRCINGITGNEKFVLISDLKTIHIKADNFSVYRPITLSELEVFNKGENKQTLMRLYSICLTDKLDLDRTDFKCGINVTADVRNQNIIDTNTTYTVLELNFARYFNSKVYSNNGLNWIKTPLGKMYVRKDSDSEEVISKWHVVRWE